MTSQHRRGSVNVLTPSTEKARTSSTRLLVTPYITARRLAQETFWVCGTREGVFRQSRAEGVPGDQAAACVQATRTGLACDAHL